MSAGTINIVSETGRGRFKVKNDSSNPLTVERNSSTGRVGVQHDASNPLQVISSAGNLDGVPVVVRAPQDGDILTYTGSAFTNARREILTDGGNF